MKNRLLLVAAGALTVAGEGAELDAEDLERLATCSFMLGRDDESIAWLERAHHCHLEDGDTLRGAYCAVWIGLNLAARGLADHRPLDDPARRRLKEMLWRYPKKRPGMFASALLPFAYGMSGWIYLGAAVVLNGIFLGYALRLFVNYSDALARRTFRYSIAYLAALFAALLVDHHFFA